jgi:hypothetical protein
MARQFAPLGWPFEIIVPMTDNLAITDGATNIVVGTSGLSGGKTLQLPPVQQMALSQNPSIVVANKAASGGTITIAITTGSGDNIVGTASLAAGATGITYRHDGIHTYFAT